MMLSGLGSERARGLGAMVECSYEAPGAAAPPPTTCAWLARESGFKLARNNGALKCGAAV